MGKLPGVEDAAEDKCARRQGSGGAGPSDQRRNRSDDASDPSICDGYPFHRGVNTAMKDNGRINNRSVD